MTYRLEPWIEKISSPVNIVLPNGEKREYKSGSEACETAFDKHYVIDEIKAIDNTVVISVTELNPMDTNWVGEEQTFF